MLQHQQVEGQNPEIAQSVQVEAFHADLALSRMVMEFGCGGEDQRLSRAFDVPMMPGKY